MAMSLCDMYVYVFYLCVYLTMTNVGDQNQTISIFQGLFHTKKKDTWTKAKKMIQGRKLKKRKLTRMNCLFKRNFFDKFHVML
jgi:hypothetical protein